MVLVWMSRVVLAALENGCSHWKIRKGLGRRDHGDDDVSSSDRSGIMAAPPAFSAVVRHPSASLHGCCRRCLTEHRAHAPHTLPASLPVRPHAVLRTCHQHGVHAPWKHTQAHMLFPNSAPWLTRWSVLFFRPQPIRQEDTNLSQQVMLKATGHYLWAISALTIQTDRGTWLRGHSCRAVFCRC